MNTNDNNKDSGKKAITEESKAHDSQLVPIYKDGKFLYNKTHFEIVNTICDEKTMLLELLKNEGRIELSNFIFRDFSFRMMGMPSTTNMYEGIVMKEDGFLHHTKPVRYKEKR